MGVRVISENNNSVNVAIDAPAKTKYTYVETEGGIYLLLLFTLNFG